MAASDTNLADALAEIQQGVLDADAYADTLTDEVVRSNVKAFGRDWSNYQQDLLEFQTIDLPQYDQEKEALGDRPTAESLGITRESLRAQFAEDMGIPALALLPDPGATYDIAPEEMRQFRKPTQAGTDKRLFESMLAAGAGRDIPRSATPRLTGQPERVSVAPPRPEQLAGRGSGRTTAASRRRAAESKAMSEMADRPAGYVAPSLERDLARYAMQDYESLMAQAMLRSQQLAAKGRTPFEDALREAQIFARKAR